MKGNNWSGAEFAQAAPREADQVLHGSITDDATSRDKEAVKDVIIKAIEAGSVHHDLATHLALYTADARESWGRSEEAGPYDVVVPRPRLDAYRRLQF
jgi:hypothetical protein